MFVAEGKGKFPIILVFGDTRNCIRSRCTHDNVSNIRELAAVAHCFALSRLGIMVRPSVGFFSRGRHSRRLHFTAILASSSYSVSFG